MHILIEHPGKTQILTELKSLRSPDWIAAPWSFPPFRLCTRLNLCAHIDLQTYMVCILETLAALITEIRTLILPTECTKTDYLRSLPICYHSDSSPDWSSQTMTLDIHMFSETTDLFLQQNATTRSWQHSSWPRTYVLQTLMVRIDTKRQMHRQLIAILPAFLTGPSSHANTVILSLISSSSLSLPQIMLPDANYN